MDNATTADLCPLDNRRTSNELWVKLVVVHFTTIAAFCHLLSIRGDRILSWRVFFYVSVPLLVVVQHALAILILLIAAVCFCVSGKWDELETISRCLSWLFGRVGRDEDREDAIYTMLPSHNSAGGTARTTAESRSQRTAKYFGRVVVVLAFVTQCIGTIFIYRRRRTHDAVTLADQRILELGISGLLTGLLTLFLLLRLPIFNSPVPDIQPNARSRLETLIISLRDTPAPPFTDPNADSPLGTQFLGDAALSFFIVLAMNVRYVLETLRHMFSPAWWNSVNTDSTPLILFLFGVSLSGLIATFATCGAPESKASRYGFNGKRRRSKKREDGHPVWICCCCPCVMALVFFPALIAVGVLASVLWGFVELAFVGEQIGSLGNWPSNQTCDPGLWSDPVGNWVWWLA